MAWLSCHRRSEEEALWSLTRGGAKQSRKALRQLGRKLEKGSLRRSRLSRPDVNGSRAACRKPRHLFYLADCARGFSRH